MTKVYTKKLLRRDKAKTGMAEYVENQCEKEEKGEVIIGRLPIMTFVAQEQLCLTKLWLSSVPRWMVSYHPVEKRKRVYLKLVDNSKVENLIGEQKVLSVYFAVAEVPVWILFFAFGTSTDKEVKLLNNCKFPPAESAEESIRNILFPNLIGFKKKACFLGYMVRCLLEAYTGRRKIDNRDDFRNKRLELASELLERS
ncbi:hypothetical protein ACH5RR_030344 [Cinchona calisaya]|uniref:RNA polymerase Rpb2 domain-containing protein n=1 Tax=Cinchona calisaya TaxID=153742 RepID=A0ABD2YUD7_9GENT